MKALLVVNEETHAALKQNYNVFTVNVNGLFSLMTGSCLDSKLAIGVSVGAKCLVVFQCEIAINWSLVQGLSSGTGSSRLQQAPAGSSRLPECRRSSGRNWIYVVFFLSVIKFRFIPIRQLLKLIMCPTVLLAGSCHCVNTCGIR